MMVSSTYFVPLDKISIYVKRGLRKNMAQNGHHKLLRSKSLTEINVKSSEWEVKVSPFKSLNNLDISYDNSISYNFKEEEKTCYICYKNSPDTIFMSCGHGGVCNDCAVSLINNKDECAECREKIEAIYRIGPKPILGNIVRSIEARRVVMKDD